MSSASVTSRSYRKGLSRLTKLVGSTGSVRRPIVFLLIALLISTIIAPSFLTIRNLEALLVSSSFLMVIAVGEAVVIITGMIDLGVQSILASGGMLVAFLSVFGKLPVEISIPIGIIFGAIVGLVVVSTK